MKRLYRRQRRPQAAAGYMISEDAANSQQLKAPPNLLNKLYLDPSSVKKKINNGEAILTKKKTNEQKHRNQNI